MNDQVEEVKQKTDIVSLIGDYITLKKAGRNYKANCPFHGEKTPSFMVSPELQIYKCFGCGVSGDCYSFLQSYEGMEFPEALKFLADKAGVKLVSLRPDQTSQKEHFYALNSLVTRFYNYVLLNHQAGKKALSYLTEERGLKMDTIKKFDIGFAPYASATIINFLTKKKKYPPKDLVSAGLVYQKSGMYIDRFAGRVIFPLYDHRGNAIGFAGRVLPGEEKKDVGKYINTPDTEVYHKSKVLYGFNLSKGDIKEAKEAVVVEGELDLISSWQAGIKNVVAIKGSALTSEQVDLLGRFTPKIVLALDSDIAGDMAARRGISTAYEKGLEIKVAKLTGFKDPDEAARKNPQGLKKAIDEAEEVWDFFINSAFNKYNSKTGEGSSRISKEITPILASITDRIVQAHYIALVAQKLAVPVSAVEEQVNRTNAGLGKMETRESTKPQVKETKTRRQLLEERLMSLAFQTDPKILLEDDLEKIFSIHLTKRLLEEYQKFSRSGKGFSASDFSRYLPKELFSSFSEMMMVDSAYLTDDPVKLSKEISLIKKEIAILSTKDELTSLAGEMKKMELKNEKDSLKKTEEEFSSLSDKLSELEES